MNLFDGDDSNRLQLEDLRDDLLHLRSQYSDDIRRDLNEVIEHARKMESSEQEALQRVSARIEALIERLNSIVARLRDRSPFTLSRDEAIKFASEVSVLESDIDLLLAILHRIRAFEESESIEVSRAGRGRSAVSSAITKLAGVLRPIIKAISSKLWNLIVGLMTPKEWSLSGEVGNTVLGLAKVRLEIKFGP